MQPGKRHHAGAKWHLNTQTHLWLSGCPPRCGHRHDAKDWFAKGHREANKQKAEAQGG